MGDHGDIPLVTIGDSALPHFSWLIKGYDKKTKDATEVFYNDKIRNAQVVKENYAEQF